MGMVGCSMGSTFGLSFLSSAHAKRTSGAPRLQSPRYSSHFPLSPGRVSTLIRADGQARLTLAGTSPGRHCRCVRLHMSTSTMRGRTDSVVLSGRRENYIAPAPHAARDITFTYGEFIHTEMRYSSCAHVAVLCEVITAVLGVDRSMVSSSSFVLYPQPTRALYGL